VFTGGCTLEAIENVCGGDLETIGSLVDESLVRSDGERFSMLETIGEYAIEALDVSADPEVVRRAHSAYYLGVARAATAGLTTPDQAVWRARLEADHGNLRAAIRWSLADGDTATALETCALLSGFWLERGYLSEGRLWLDEALAVPAEPSSIRARALNANGVLSHYQGDYERADELCGAALELFRALGDQKGVADAVTGLALVRRTRGDYRNAEALFREALAINEELDDKAGTARTLYRYGIALMLEGDAGRARPLFVRSLELFRTLGDSTGIALDLQGLAFSRPPGLDSEGLVRVEESLEILRALGDRRNVAKVLVVAADINADLGDTERAAGQLAEALTLFVEFGDRWFWGWSLELAASLAASVGDPERAARIFGAADVVWEAIGAPLPGKLRDRHDRVLADLRIRLGENHFETARGEGTKLPIGATIELVQPTESRPEGDTPEGLTARELEVLALVAEGLTDAEVAERLVVSIRTVHAHLRSIYRKLDVRTRSAATRYALQHDLAL
jgi:DNA-binding CsgD family transcriptional regulator/tetratricopeptide (TPR) repeat protein